MVSYPKEERLLTFRDGILYVLKRIVHENQAKKSIRNFFTKSKSSETPVDQMAQQDRGQIKSRNEISRLFKIDIKGHSFSRISGVAELELILHFVNKEMDPSGKPILKTFLIRSDDETKTFLAKLQAEAKERSTFYKWYNSINIQQHKLKNWAQIDRRAGIDVHKATLTSNQCIKT